MGGLTPEAVGLLVILVGVTLGVVTVGLTLFVARVGQQGKVRLPWRPVLPVQEPWSRLADEGPAEGVILIRPGGRVIYLNAQAQAWFGLQAEDLPHLEVLARRIRPQEAFLRLCAAPDQGRFTLGRLRVEAASLPLPTAEGVATLVLMRPAQALESRALQVEPPRAFEAAANLIRSMGITPDLEQALQAILSTVDRLLPNDYLELTVWDEETRTFVPYRFESATGGERKVEKRAHRYRPDEGLTGFLATHKEPLLIPDLHHTDHPALAEAWVHIPRAGRSYMGVPLVADGEVIGTLELVAEAPGIYGEPELRLLQALAEPATVALAHALSFARAEEQIKALRNLVTLAQGLTQLQTPQTFVAGLVEGARDLVGAEIAGFLLYCEGTGVLEAQWPFVGVPQAFVASYRTHLSQSDREVWERLQKPFVVANAAEDPWFKRLGLADLARGAGMRDTLIVPLRSADRFLGVLQLSNRRDRPFWPEDIGLGERIAQQMSPVVENFVLLQESRERARRAESLRRIANLIASEATLDEMLRFVLQELAHLLGASRAAILLLDEDQGALEVHRPSVVGVDETTLQRLGKLSVQDPSFRLTVTRLQRPFLSRDVQMDPRVAPVYRPLVEAFPDLHAAIVVPLMVRDQSVGEILLGHAQPGAFQRSDVQLALSVAGQVALAVERQRLLRQSDQALRRRVEQMQALVRLSRELTVAPSLERLFIYLRDEAVRLLGADCATLRLLDDEGRVDPKYVLRCHRQQDLELSPRERQALEAQRPRVEHHLAPAEQPHPGVQSALTVPLIYQGQPVGVLDLHAQAPGHFDLERERFAQALGVQAALAIGIHREREVQLRTIARLKQQAATLELVQDFFTTYPLSAPPDTLLTQLARVTAEALEAVGWALVAYDPGAGLLTPVASSEEHPLTEEWLWDRLTARLSPSDTAGIYRLVEQGVEEFPWLLQWKGRFSQARVALARSPEGELLGAFILLFASPQEATPASEQALGWVLPALSLLFQWRAVQQQHVAQTQRLEAEAQRAHTALQAAEQGIVRWLHKDLEQMIDVNTLARSKERLETALEIATSVNRQPERQAVFDALGHELLERLAMELVILVQREEEELHLRQVYGMIPQGVHLESLLGQRNPLREVIRTHRAILIGDLIREESPWQDSPLLRRLQARAVLVIPIGTDLRTEAAVLAISYTSLPPFSAEDVQAFTLMGRQVGIALQNLNLLHETSRRLQEVDLLLAFSRQLGELDPDRLLNTLLESALAVVGNAHAGFVALWDERLNGFRIHAARGYGDAEALLGVTFPARGLMGTTWRENRPQRVDELDFVAAYPFDQEALLRYQQATLDRLPISALAVPIASGEQALGVLMIENFNSPAAFQEEDEELALALARQTGLMLENARLLEDTQTRAGQLQALTNVAAIMTATLESEEILNTLLPQLATALPYDVATLWLRADDDAFVLWAARGFPDDENRRGIQVALEDSHLLKTIVHTQAPLAIADVRQDQTFPWPQDYPYRSWLGVPLVSRGEILGVIVLEKAEPHFFTAEWVEVARTFAAQAAAALQNARLYEESLQRAQELHERTTRLELVYTFTAELSASLDPEYILRLTAQHLRRALSGTQVGMVIDDEGTLRLMALDPISEDEELPRSLTPLELLEQMAESRGVVVVPQPLTDPRLTPWRDLLAQMGSGPMVLFPLVTREILHGIAWVRLPEGRRLSPAELDLGRSITQQAAVAYQNARLYEEMRHLTQELERRVAERTRELTREHRRAQILLRIITELASSLDLDQVLNRTLDLMNTSLGSEQSTILLRRPGEKTFYLRAARGYADSPPPGGRPTALPVEDTLAGWVVQHREPVLVPDLREDPRWKPGPDGRPPHRSAVVVPLQVGEDVLGAFCLFHRQPGFFSPDHLDLAVAAARQVAVAINNAELFNLIRDQSERLGQEVRQREVEATRARAILESVADGIVVTDAKGRVTLFNPSAERLLGIPAEHILGEPLDRFSGLFGAASGEWLATVQRWSENPASYQPGEVYEQRLDLDDGRVLSVRLTPVLTQREFLGTVSVFRDITHQVEVDRLKSEFVATVSHELRTPMTAIKGYVELLLKGVVGPLNEQQARFLEVVRTNTDRLSALVNDLLDISRIEAGKIAFTPQPVSLPELVDEVLAEARHIAEEEGRTMTFVAEVPADLPPVWGDRERLRQILANLVDNGYRYTPDGGQVLVRALLQADEVQIDVVDNGIGIPPAEQERIFERFYRGENPLVMGSAGTGLGLPIVRHLVEMHGGRIWVTSSGVPGEGSVFSFTLPLAQEKSPAEGGQDG